MEHKTGIGPRGLRWIVWVLIIIMIVTIGLAWLFYAEPYEFFQEAASYLGGMYTWDEQNPNVMSRRIFTIGFVVIGIYSIFLE